jgi:hypothetical protein
VLVNKRIFSTHWYIQDKKKWLEMYSMYTTLHDYLICFFAFYVNEYDHTWATGILLVLVWIRPSCSNTHKRLIRSISSAGWTVHRCLHFLPMGAVWLFFISHVHTCCFKVSYHMHSWIGGTLVRIGGLAASNPFCQEQKLSRPLLAIWLGEYWFRISRYVYDSDRPLAPILRQSRCSLIYDVYWLA